MRYNEQSVPHDYDVFTHLENLYLCYPPYIWGAHIGMHELMTDTKFISLILLNHNAHTEQVVTVKNCVTFAFSRSYT